MSVYELCDVLSVLSKATDRNFDADDHVVSHDEKSAECLHVRSCLVIFVYPTIRLSYIA